MKQNKYYLFFVIIILGAILRLFNLSSMPPALNWDEISHGYNAYSILKTGSDEWGQQFPLTNFRAYGDYPLPLNLYITIPFIALFGLTEVSIRAPHAVLGVLTIIAAYFLALGISKKKAIALLTAFFVAVDPWLLFTSRFVLQSNLSIFLLTTTFALFFNRSKHRYFLPLSLVAFGLTLFSYHTTRIFSPLLLLPFIVLYRKELLKRIPLFILIFFFAPLPFILSNPDARARSNEVFILNEGAVAQIEEQRNLSTLPSIARKILYNKPAYLISKSAKNYIQYFSPQFLFTQGGTQYQFSLPNHGLLYIVSLPFFYIGVIVLLKEALISFKKEYQLLLSWLLLAPIPASITTEQFAVLRASTMLPLPQLLVAVGFLTVVHKFLKKGMQKTLAIVVMATVILILLGSYLTQYFSSYRENYSWTWQYGYKEATSFINKNYENFDTFVITKKYGEPHEFLLFYSQYDPAKYKSDQNLIRFTQSNWWWVDSFDKFVFVNDWQIPKEGETFVTESKKEINCASLRCALITSPGNVPLDWSLIETIHFLDNKPAFEIYENK